MIANYVSPGLYTTTILHQYRDTTPCRFELSNIDRRYVDDIPLIDIVKGPFLCNERISQ